MKFKYFPLNIFLFVQKCFICHFSSHNQALFMIIDKYFSSLKHLSCHYIEKFVKKIFCLNLGGSCLHSGGSWRQGVPPSSEVKRVWVTFPHCPLAIRSVQSTSSLHPVQFIHVYILCVRSSLNLSFVGTVYLWINGLLTCIHIYIHTYMYSYHSSLHVFFYI